MTSTMPPHLHRHRTYSKPAFTYDRLGRMTSAITAGVSTNLFEYDGLDLLAETQNGIAITRATDNLGRPAGFTFGPDYEVGYGYDAYGRFHSVSSSVASATSMANYAYLPGSDLLSGMTNSSGFFWSRTYEQQRKLIASVENRFGENPISLFDYANDSLARRTRRVDNLTVTNDFGYNVRSKVIGAAMGTNRYRYAYDPIGNRLTATNNAEGWTYLSNPLNQYTNIADGLIVEPEYDLDGNMTATGDGWRYVWNGENRMIRASNSQHTVTYAYDHQGRMVTKTVDGSSRQYLWDGYNIVADARATGTNWFVWGMDLSGSLQGAGGVGGLLAEVKDGEPYFAAYDANGNITEYIGTNGVTEAHYEYSPFGEIVAQSGELADAFTHRFSTKPWCGVTGLSEYLFRKYEPGMGRWMSRDPIGEEGFVALTLAGDDTSSAGALLPLGHTEHVYAFVVNSPVANHDPLGLMSEAACKKGINNFFTSRPKCKEKFDEYGKKCPLSTECLCCPKHPDKDPGAPAGCSRDGKLIVICIEDRWFFNAKDFTHELQHYFDICDKGIVSQEPSEENCFRRMCSEMRADYAARRCKNQRHCWKRILLYGYSKFPECKGIPSSSITPKLLDPTACRLDDTVRDVCK